jgi:hypothetical protein
MGDSTTLHLPVSRVPHIRGPQRTSSLGWSSEPVLLGWFFFGSCFVSGHDFSRAARARMKDWASAPARSGARVRETTVEATAFRPWNQRQKRAGFSPGSNAAGCPTSAEACPERGRIGHRVERVGRWVIPPLSNLLCVGCPISGVPNELVRWGGHPSRFCSGAVFRLLLCIRAWLQSCRSRPIENGLQPLRAAGLASARPR